MSRRGAFWVIKPRASVEIDSLKSVKEEKKVRASAAASSVEGQTIGKRYVDACLLLLLKIIDSSARVDWK